MATMRKSTTKTDPALTAKYNIMLRKLINAENMLKKCQDENKRYASG